MPDTDAVKILAFDTAKKTTELTVAQWFLSPGKTLHPSWWERLNLATWENVYHTTPSLARLIDIQIRRVAHLTEFSASFFNFSETQKLMVTGAIRLPKLVLALGLLLLGCPDYLLVRAYRQELESVLDEANLNQLWMLWRGQNNNPTLPAEKLIESAWECGYHALSTAQYDDPLWLALRLQLAAPKESAEYVAEFANEQIWGELRRLERFL